MILDSSTEIPSDPITFPFANERMASVSSCIVGQAPSGMFSGHWSRPLVILGSSLGDLVMRRVCNCQTHRSLIRSAVSQEYAVVVFDVRRAAVLLPFQIHRLQGLVEAGLIAFPIACFKFEDEFPEQAEHGSLVNLSKIFASHLHYLSKVALVGFCAWTFPRLISLLPCCAPLGLHTRTRSPTLCSTRAVRTRCQFGRSRKHDVGHVGGDVTDAGAIGD